MNTQKVAISMPPDLVATIDGISRKLGVSRSKYISSILREKIREERQRALKEAYDRVYSDESIREEQLETLRFFEGAGNGEGQEW